MPSSKKQFPTHKQGRENSGGTTTKLKSKLVPIGRLIQHRLLWVCNLVPHNVFDDDYFMPLQQSDTSFMNSGKQDNIIFDNDMIVQDVYYINNYLLLFNINII